jgi:hypothetical protein
MKHPFYTLYYTGLAVLISLLLFGGLFISNLSNIVDLIPKENKPKVQSNVVINPMVLETTTPKSFVELNSPKVEKKRKTETEKPKLDTEDTNSIHNNMNNETPNTVNNLDTTQKRGDTTL